MTTHLEIEYKALLSKEAFAYFLEKEFKDAKVITQTNEYFVDAKQHLKEHLCSLRVRHLDGTYEFTLKEPKGFSKLEFNQMLSPSEYQALLSHQPFASSVLDELATLDIHLEDLSSFTTLTTYRYEKPYLGGVLCIDESHYSGITDYEIEYEAENEKDGKTIFEVLLKQVNQSYTSNCQGKMRRAFLALEEMQ